MHDVKTHEKLEGDKRFVLSVHFTRSGDQPTAIEELNEGEDHIGETIQGAAGRDRPRQDLPTVKVIKQI